MHYKALAIPHFTGKPNRNLLFIAGAHMHWTKDMSS